MTDVPMLGTDDRRLTRARRWPYRALVGVELSTVTAGLAGAVLWDPYVSRPMFVRTVARWLDLVPGLRIATAAMMEPVVPAFLTIVVGCVLIARRHDMTPRQRWWGAAATVLVAVYIVVSLGLMGDLIKAGTPLPE